MAALSRFCSSIIVLSALIPSLASAQGAPPAAADPAALAAAPAEPAPAEPAPAEPAAAPAAEAPPPAPPEGAGAPPPEAPKPKPPPYHLPFQLRPAQAVTVIRGETSFGFYKAPNDGPSGTAVVPMLLAAYKVTPNFSPVLRLGMVSNSPPAGESKVAFTNPVVGGIYGIKLSPETRLALFLGLTVPVGSGGGDTQDPDRANALRAGIATRAAMDNAMFATNYFTVFPGVSFAYVDKGFTVQAEVTLLQLMRVRGKAYETDESRTNLTMGLHVGYFFIPQLSLGAELRHQRWLSTPASVDNDPASRDTTTVAIGPRVHFKLGEKVAFRPGIIYSRGLDKPLTNSDFNIVQLDLPFIF